MASKGTSFAPFLVLALVLAANSVVGGARKGVGIYVLRRGDFTLQFTNYGATMLSAVLPDKDGTPKPSLLFRLRSLSSSPESPCPCRFDLTSGIYTFPYDCPLMQRVVVVSSDLPHYLFFHPSSM